MKQRLLFDTHAFLWLREGRLSRPAQTTYQDSGNEVYLSLVSVWEMVIKTALKKLVLDAPLRQVVSSATAAGIRLLGIELQHLWHLEALPHHHADPFDRLLIAQALREDMTVVGNDKAFDPYGVRRIW